MQKIEGVELKDLVQQASEEFLRKQQLDGVKRIQKLLSAIFDLGLEIKGLESQLTKKREQLEKKQRVVEELKQGNWSILADDESKKNDELEKEI